MAESLQYGEDEKIVNEWRGKKYEELKKVIF